MKIKHLACLVALLASLSASNAATVTAWTFDNVLLGLNASPLPSTGLGTASAMGLSNAYNNTNSISNPDVQSLAGSFSGGPKSWRVRGSSSIVGSRGNGWSTSAPLGTQGAQFAGGTFGYYKIMVSFDVYATADAEADLQVQYTMDGKKWNNASISAGGNIANNTADPNIVNGSYIILSAGWNNQITVDLSGLSGVDNNASFAIRLVNAATGSSCVDTTGAVYNNTSGNWTFDNVVIQGTSIDTIAGWAFDSLGTVAAPYNNPPATIGYGSANSIGMTNSYNGTTSLPSCDVTSTAGASTGSGSYGWRIRGTPGNGWSTQAPIATQGAEFDASTAGYSNIVCSFDLYFTTQGDAKMCVLYTADGWATTNVAQTLFYGANATFIQTNSTSVNTVAGTYFYQTNGQGFYNNIMVDLTGVHGAENNPLFGIRIANAATGNDDLNFQGNVYNNSSGNWRFDNVVIGGTAGNLPPTIAYDPNASVDGAFTNTFTDDPIWRANLSHIYVNGQVLTNTAYTTNVAGEIVFTPSESLLLQSSSLKNIQIIANGYGTARYSQPLAAGVAEQLAITTEPAGPAASGGTLTINPVLLVSDQYGNGTTNPYANVSVTASAGGSGGWILGGDTGQASVAGLIAFTNLTASLNGAVAVSNALVTFTVNGYPGVSVTNSTSFVIGLPPIPFTAGNLAVLKIDSLANNTTFSVIEVKPSVAGQTAPVNTVPISATGTNALRLTSAGSTGRLALSDDGTLICFGAFADDSAATPDETYNLNRAAAGLNYTNQLTIGMTYTSISLGGSQPRAACILPDGYNWIADDKGGLYEGNAAGGSVDQPNLNAYNNVVVKSFGGTPYIETQKAVNGQNIPVIYALGFDPDTGLYDITFANNLTTDPNASDFYMVSSDGGSTYDILYLCDQISGTQGIIKKYSLVSGNWNANGSFTNATGIDGLFATTNSDGGAILFYTTGSGGTGGNQIIRVTDASGYNQNLSIVSSNVIYTAAAGTSLKGLTFVPQPVAYAAELIPPPVLTAGGSVAFGAPFVVTNTPADAIWHAAITNITVNGTFLPSGAYDATQSGRIIFNPAQSSGLLLGSGVKNLVISATGYSDDSVVQNIAALAPPVIGGTSISGTTLTLAFTSAPGLSFSVLGTNDLTAPIATWPVLGTAIESPAGSGNYNYTNTTATNGRQFFILRQP